MVRKTIWTLLFVLPGAVGILLAQQKANVTITEWATPTPNSHPHDPLATADGALWYTAQNANKLGRLDLKTGQIREWTLKTENSGPHGLIDDKEGNIWFTANSKAYIGKLNPKTSEITEYPMPDPAARDPHTPIFDNNGILWFTVQSGNFLGKLNPATGQIMLKKSPTNDSRPYGLRLNSKGILYYCEFNSNKLASIDPATFEIMEFVLPNAGARPRRIAIAPDDRVYYADYARGYLGRLDPKTGKIDEWASPGGPRSQPYGIAATPDGIIWYSESNVQPNTIVRFDPKTYEFQTAPVPSGGGVLRHIVTTPDGKDLLIASSGVDKVGIVRIGR